MEQIRLEFEYKLYLLNRMRDKINIMTEDAKRDMKLDNERFFYWKTIVKESDEFKSFMRKRNIKKQQTKNRYIVSLTSYCVYAEKSLNDILAEAKTEQKTLDEEDRHIIDLLEEYRPWMSEQGLSNLTIITRFNDILRFYRHNRIHIPQLQTFNPNEEYQLEFSDLPTEEDIQRAIDSTTSLSNKALFYFAASSGTAKQEIAELTVQSFIDATYIYHGEIDNIENVLKKLEGRDDIVPLFKMKRQKTGKKYHTCCTPQATKAILTLLRSKGKINNEDSLFGLKYAGISKAFQRANLKHNWPKIKNYYYFGCHRLRKRHASLLIRDKELANYLEGRKEDRITQTYFFEDPEKVRDEYKKHIPALTIGKAEYYGVSSEEYEELKEENERINEDYERLKESMDAQKSEYEKKIRDLESINVALSDRVDNFESRLDNITREADIRAILDYASKNETVNKYNLMDTVMTLYDADYDAKRVSIVDDEYKQTLINRAFLIKDQLSYDANSPEIKDNRLEIEFGKEYTELKERTIEMKKYILETKYHDLQLTRKNNKDINCELVKYVEELLENKQEPTNDEVEAIILRTLNVYDDIFIIDAHEYTQKKEKRETEHEQLESIRKIEKEMWNDDYD